MNNRNYLYCILLVSGLIFILNLADTYSLKFDKEQDLPEELNESFILLTDRNIYAVNENIYFKAFNYSHPLIIEKKWSKIFYVELVNNSGNAVYKGKFRISESGADGIIKIPENLLTGNYYLVGYTKWLRNFSPLKYAYLKIKVINPYNTALQGKSQNLSDTNNYDNSYKLNFDNNKILCKTNESVYGIRKKVNVTLQFPDSRNLKTNNYCLSVIKSNAIDQENFGIINSGIEYYDYTDNNLFLPELNNISISGTVIYKDNKTPVEYANIQLSVLGDNFNFFNYKTSDDGKFLFSIQPGYIKKEMFIACENNYQRPVEIHIDNDFSAKSVRFNNIPFSLSEEEQTIAEEIMFNMQLNKLYTFIDSNSSDNKQIDTASLNFYGPALSTTYLKKYIELPTLEEVFIELVPDVIVLKRKGESFLQVQGKIKYHPDFSNFKPLILLDQMPVYDVNELLNISPSLIDHIEVVNEVYVKGETKYGGIVSIYSKKGDMAGIKLPENSMFFNFIGPVPKQKYDFPEYNKPGEKTNIPDFRNCLYWDPDISAAPDSQQNIEFYTSDATGEYLILIRGVNEDGKIITGNTKFVVK
jgi:hypothetical protein